MVKDFDIEVNSVETGKIYPIYNVSSSTKIVDLKVQLELIAGIPTHLQRITYLDQGDMQDESTLRHHDVVDSARLKLNIWSSWLALVQACVRGNINEVMDLGVTADSDFHNPNTERMTEEVRKEWFLARSAIALYIASHRGNLDLMRALIKSGGPIATTTKNGRNVLHVAASSGKESAIEVLLENGAGELITERDKFGKTPLETAASSGHKSAERRLFLFQWRKRANQAEKLALPSADDLMAHQLYDSTSRTWLSGKQSQLYLSNILPPQEFQGTGINSRKSGIQTKISGVTAPMTGKNVEKCRKKKVARIADDAVLMKGKRPNGSESIESIQNSDKLKERNYSNNASSSRQKSQSPPDAAYKAKRLAYLKNYIPEEMIKFTT